MALGRKIECGKSLDISERLARHALEGAQRDLNRAYSELYKELYTAKISQNEAYLSLIDSMRSELAQ